jgi:hypothetical protein
VSTLQGAVNNWRFKFAQTTCELHQLQAHTAQVEQLALNQAAVVDLLFQQANDNANTMMALLTSNANLVQQVQMATGLMHAVLVAVGAPLTESVCLPGGLQLLPTASSPLLQDLVPLVATVIGGSSRWGADLMRLCAVHSRTALQELP